MTTGAREAGSRAACAPAHSEDTLVQVDTYPACMAQQIASRAESPDATFPTTCVCPGHQSSSNLGGCQAQHPREPGHGPMWRQVGMVADTCHWEPGVSDSGEGVHSMGHVGSQAHSFTILRPGPGAIPNIPFLQTCLNPNTASKACHYPDPQREAPHGASGRPPTFSTLGTGAFRALPATRPQAQSPLL